MAFGVKSSGTQAATVTTEHTLLATTDSGVYVLAVDTSVMADGDELELRIKRPILTGGTIRTAYFVRFNDAQGTDDLVAMSVPITAPFGTTVTLKQTAGTGRSFIWSVEQLS